MAPSDSLPFSIRHVARWAIEYCFAPLRPCGCGHGGLEQRALQVRRLRCPWRLQLLPARLARPLSCDSSQHCPTGHTCLSFSPSTFVLEWCVDPRDTSGLNYMNGIRPPRCLPKYSCSALSNGQLQPMRGTLCPPLGETEPPFRGQMTTKSATTIWSTAHSLNYCNFSIQPYVIDRSTSPCRCCIPDGSPIISIAALGGQESCGQVNNNLNAGVGIAVNQMAERCFGSQRGHLTSKMQQCVRLIQSFGTTCRPN